MLCATYTLTVIGFLLDGTSAELLDPAALEVHPAAECVEGMVEALDLENDEFTLKVGEKRRTLQLDDSTLYYIDEKISTRELVLVVGKTVTVTHTDGLAERIVATLEDF